MTEKTQQQIADELGVNQGTVSRVLCKNSVMTEKTQQQIADELGVNQGTVSRVLCKNSVMTEKTHKQPRTRIYYQINQGST